MSDDKEQNQSEQPKQQESQEEKIVLPEKDWQLALGNRDSRKTSENTEED